MDGRSTRTPPGKPTRLPPAAGCHGLSLRHRGEHWVVYVDTACAWVFARRTPSRFERIEDIEISFSHAEQAIAGIPRARYKLLADVRSGPARNDESFEQANNAHRGKLLFGFHLTVALVLSPAGQLQIQRYARLDRHDLFVTRDLREAFSHLGLAAHELPIE